MGTSFTSLKSIAGNNGSGPIVVDADGGIWSLNNYNGASLNFTRHSSPPFTPLGVAGDQRGLIAFGGSDRRLLAYTTSPSPSASWNSLPPAPFVITDIVGDVQLGVAIYGGADNRQVACLPVFLGQWRTLQSSEAPITAFTGENSRGLAIAMGRVVAIMTSYAQNTWTRLLAQTSFDIVALAGENSRGVFACGGSKAAYLDNYNASAFSSLREAPCTLQAVSGNNVTGVVAVGGADSNLVVCLQSYTPGAFWGLLSG